MPSSLASLLCTEPFHSRFYRAAPDEITTMRNVTKLVSIANQLLEDAVKMEKCWTTAGRCAATSAEVWGQDDATGQ